MRLWIVTLLGCHGADPVDSTTTTPSPTETAPPTPTIPTVVDTAPDPTTPWTTPTDDPPLLKFAAFGDYGSASTDEADVAALVSRVNPDFIVTLGDNVYDTTEGHDERIGQFYHEWMSPYSGAYGAGSADGVNRFWACLGNHDWDANIDDWYAYFTLPNNERYWSQDFGVDPETGGPLLQITCTDSDAREPDGNNAESVQGAWLAETLANSTARWKIVVFHHPPWSSALHGPNRRLQWPYAAWGADLVLHGHDHVYERLVRDGLPFVTDGRGGASLYALQNRLEHSQVAENTAFGLTTVEVREDTLTVVAYDTLDRITDRFMLRDDRPLTPHTPLVRYGSTWRYADGGADLGTAWRQPSYDDSAWATGPGQLGFGDLDEASTLDYGELLSNTITSYYRIGFEVADPAAWPGLQLDLLRDDGAVLYLNGVEVYRNNLPAGAITAATLAQSDLVPPAEDTPLHATLPTGALVAGRNVLAVEVHQASPSTRDLSFDLALSGMNASWLVRSGDVWAYDDDGVAPAAGWETSTDQTGWKSGASPLGYGRAVTTPLDAGDPTQKHPTTWLRRSFDVADPGAIDGLFLRIIRDDGAIVYLNGVEVTRFDLPRGAFGPGTYAAREAPEGWGTWAETWIDRSALQAGTNTIAVELHQALAAGETLAFDLELATTP